LPDEFTKERRSMSLLTVADVAARLGVKKDTVYAYVSRGLLTRRAGTPNSGSFYDSAEVEALALRSRRAVPPRALPPVFRSALTVIVDGAPYYRGLPVCMLAREKSYEQIVDLLWRGAFETEKLFPASHPEPVLAETAARLVGETLPLESLRCLVPFIAGEDALRHDTSHEQVSRKAARLMVRLLSAMTELSAPAEPGLAALLWSRLSPRPATPGLLAALDATLVLVADHDLGAPSTAAVRLAAAVRADIYSVVSVGLNSGGGAVQSASTLAIENDLFDLNARQNVDQMVGEKLRRGHEMQGFGHRAYPAGDPRARLVLDLLQQSGEADEEIRRIGEIVEIQRQRGREPPNIGFAIAALVHCAGMRRGSGEAIFNFARIAGWVAHAMEEYDAPQNLPRLQSVYIGPAPDRNAQ
jgi:citrate synthase